MEENKNPNQIDIELSEEMMPEVFGVKSFKEKPDLETAQQFIEAGNFLWNANISAVFSVYEYSCHTRNR